MLADSHRQDRLVGKPHAAFDRVGKVDQARFVVEDPDVEDLGVEHLAQALADQVVHRLHLDLGREAPLDLIDDRELGGPLVRLGQEPLRLVEQAGILKRDAEARRERREHADIRLRECVLAVQVLERDDADRLAAGDQGREQRGQWRLARQDGGLIEQLRHRREVFVDEVRLAGFDDVLPNPDERDRLLGEPDATFDRVHERDRLGGSVDDADVDDLRVEHVAHTIPDDVVHGLHVDLRCQAVLDLVDDRELSRALVRLLEQALGLVEQAGVLERHAHAGREGAQHSLVGLGEGVLLDALEPEDADDAVRSPDRDAQPGDGVRPADLDRPGVHLAPRRCRCGALDWT